MGRELEKSVDRYMRTKMLGIFGLSADTDCEIREAIVSNYNINYVVGLAHHLYIMRVNVEQQSGLRNQIEYEYKTMAHLYDYGVVPRPYYLDTTREWLPYDFMVQEYIHGRPLDYDEQEGISEAAGALATVHKAPFPSEDFLIRHENPLRDLYDEDTRMLKRYEKRRSSDKELVKKGWRLLAKLERSAIYHESEFKATSIVHTDVGVDNFIRSLQGIVIIDWEKPRIDDPSYDLCVFLGRPPQIWASSRLMTEGEKSFFLSCYSDRSGIPLQILERKTRICQPFTSFRWIMWGAHRTADADEDKISPELSDFHSVHYNKYRNVCSVENVEFLLGNRQFYA
jgi:aminoglycoside phosphotransferase (APT) family kinase protein